MIKSPIISDLSIFTDNSVSDEHVRFGLPSAVKFCRKCVESNQRPSTTVEYKNTAASKKETIIFDDNEVCAACNFSLKKEKEDWEAREEELIDLCNRFRRNDGRYDCIVPGSGGKDSLDRIIFWLHLTAVCIDY